MLEFVDLLIVFCIRVFVLFVLIWVWSVSALFVCEYD